MKEKQMVPEHWINGEYMTQVDDAWMEAARAGVLLALKTLQCMRTFDVAPPESTNYQLVMQCLDYLSTYADWEKMGAILEPWQLDYLLKKNYTPGDESESEEDPEWAYHRQDITYDFKLEDL